MKKNCKLHVCFFSILLLILSVVNVCADNPIVQTNFTADPAPMVHDGTFYIYSGHDEDSASGWFSMREWRCYSSTDMANWTDHGTPMDLGDFSWAASDAWAAQCIYRNGTFYFYVTAKPIGGGWGVGVGVSDSPTGPFVDAIGAPIVSYQDYYIDPTVYIDDNGQAYLYWGNPGLWMVKLNEDMISTSGSIVEMPQNAQTVGNMYAEAPWFYKRNGLYYMVFATDDTGVQSVAYSTSSGPTGPWSFKGKIMNPSGTSWTLHPGIEDYKGHSYIIYHNGALQPGGDAFHRSVCVDEFSYNADGTIPMIQATTSGPTQIEYLNPYDRTEAETICWESGVETEICSEGGMNVSTIENGDYIKVKGVDFGTGATSFEARVASNTSGGNIEIRLDSETGTLVGTCSVSGTGGWQTWTTRTCTISGATGVHDLYFRFTGGSGFLFNFNWWKFSGGPTSPPTTEPTAAPTPVPGTISIACGSSSDVGIFLADQYYSGGSTFNNSNIIDVSRITEDTPPPELFNNERYGEMTYTIPNFTSGDSYIVTLYFAETYLTSAGSRLFDVSINGDTVLSGFDLYASAGGQNIAIARSFTVAGNASGQIVIRFIAGTENPKINGISIRPGEGPTTPPTPTPIDTPTPTPPPTTPPGDCNVFFDPPQSLQPLNSTFKIDVVVDSGNQELAAYGFNISYNENILDVVDVEEGAEGFISAANTENPGEIIVSGFDTSGTGPGSDLQVLIITFHARAEGTTTLGLYVDQLVDGGANTIGTACGESGSIEVTDVIRGDTDGDGDIDIIDALLTAQYYVELDPSPFIPENADTDCDGDVDIVDALLIAQYYVELITGFC